MADEALWRKVKQAYQRGLSGRACAEKFGVPYGTLRDRAKADGWTVSRQRIQRTASAKSEQKVADVIADEAADTTRRQLDVMRAGLDKAESLLADVTNSIQFSAWAGGVKALVQTQRLALGLAAPKDPQDPKKGGVGDGPVGERPDFQALDPAEAARRVREALRADHHGRP